MDHGWHGRKNWAILLVSWRQGEDEVLRDFEEVDGNMSLHFQNLYCIASYTMVTWWFKCSASSFSHCNSILQLNPWVCYCLQFISLVKVELSPYLASSKTVDNMLQIQWLNLLFQELYMHSKLFQLHHQAHMKHWLTDPGRIVSMVSHSCSASWHIFPRFSFNNLWSNNIFTDLLLQPNIQCFI